MSKPFQYGGLFLRSAVQAVQQQDGAIKGPREELQLYLKSGAESTVTLRASVWSDLEFSSAKAVLLSFV